MDGVKRVPPARLRIGVAGGRLLNIHAQLRRQVARKMPETIMRIQKRPNQNHRQQAAQNQDSASQPRNRYAHKNILARSMNGASVGALSSNPGGVPHLSRSSIA